MHPETHLAPHRAHAAGLRVADLRAEADAHRLATTARRPRAVPTRSVRTRLGWTLVELGLKLAATPRTPTPTPCT
ncbi:hypothetical protein [Streptomyces sp. NPDC002328]|uniref:hypothetical protein n=1 Tax=Streptomyces sp. NPDC002328 TaxID=3364642 RepID=UPI0036A8F4DA